MPYILIVRYSMDAHQFLRSVSFGSTLEDTMHIECQVMASGYLGIMIGVYVLLQIRISTTAVNERDYRDSRTRM